MLLMRSKNVFDEVENNVIDEVENVLWKSLSAKCSLLAKKKKWLKKGITGNKILL